MSLLLLTEGKGEALALRVLARKLIPASQAIHTIYLPKGNLLSSPKKVAARIRAERSKGAHTTKVLICVDSECTPVEETQHLVKQNEKEIAKLLPWAIPVLRYVIVDHSLEGWLLGDLGALERVLGSAVDPQAVAPRDCRPEKTMRQLFARQGKEFIKMRDNPRIAEAARPAELAKGSPTFRLFRRVISDP